MVALEVIVTNLCLRGYSETAFSSSLGHFGFVCLPGSCNLISPSKAKNEMLTIRQGHAQHLPAK